MRKAFLVMLLTLGLASFAGCRAFNKEMTKLFYSKATFKEGTFAWSSSRKFELTDKTLQDTTFAGSVQAADVNLCYQYGLKEQADYFANQINGLISHIEQSIGLEIRYEVKAYLLRVDDTPENYDMSFKYDPNKFYIPLFVESGNESCKAIISQNLVYPDILMHELVEMSLSLHKESGVVLPDVEWKESFLKGHIPNYTRWFREGLANYAGLQAYEMTRRDIDNDYPAENSQIHSYAFPQPFSSLDKVGIDLFKWHQYSSDKLNNEYYNAALGLFLIIQDRFGEDTITTIIDKIKERDYLDGRDLIKLINQTLNTDIKDLVEKFHFPKTGLKTRPLTAATVLNENLDVKEGLLVTEVEPNSPAENADIKKNDVILKIGEKSVANLLDFELAVFESMTQKSVKLTIWRKQQPQIITNLQLKPEN